MGGFELEHFELWLPVVGYEGLYEVSNLGRVRSLPHPTKTRREGVFRTSPGKLLLLKLSRDGYFELSLSNRSKGIRTYSVASLVAAAWIGPKPPGLQIDHIDGNKQNNCNWNLRYLTAKENINAGNYFRTWVTGEDHPGVKISDADVVEMRRLAIEGMKRKDIQAMFKISRRHLYSILNKEARVKP